MSLAVPPDFSNYLVVPSKSTSTNGAPATKQATMKAALQKFQTTLASANASSSTNGHLSNEYPNLVGRPTDPTSPATFAAVQKNGETEEDSSDAQNELFRQGFEQGYQDAKIFSEGLKGLQAVEGVIGAVGAIGGAIGALETKTTEEKKTRTVGGARIGHLDQWKKIRARQFVEANPTSSSTTSSGSSSVWDKVLRLLHLRSSSTTPSPSTPSPSSTGSTLANLESTLGSVWEYMDGFEAGVKAFESGAVDDPDAADPAQTQTNAVEKWGAQFKDANGQTQVGKMGLRSLF